MKDRDAYLAAGRSDPLSDAQRAEHPYDFVALPDRPRTLAVPGHDRYAADRLSGTLELVYVTGTPLHVGSGAFDTAAQCGLAGGDDPVRGIARTRGRAILPGSSWKGAVRARYEVLTASRLGIGARGGRVDRGKLPEPLRCGSGRHCITIDDTRVTRALKPRTVASRGDRSRTLHDLRELSPAEALFGALGYRGRVHPGDGRIAGPTATAPLDVTPLESPALHRLAQPGEIRSSGAVQLTISRVEGRKFYYDGPLVQNRQARGQGHSVSEPIDHVPAGATIALKVHLEAVTPAELGALLLAAGYGAGVGVLRFGGYKPAGLGKVELDTARAVLWPGAATRTWRRPPASPYDLEAAVAEARRTLLDVQALGELHQITTRLRP
jgi:CRISPR/Cas system CSM-associated protein Csm3 (group 7 of RAMP superfamily)